MTNKGITIALLLLVAGSLVEGSSQNVQPAKVPVEIMTTKKFYAEGEPIRFRVLIENARALAFYLASRY
jgi:hypothetical protein